MRVCILSVLLASLVSFSLWGQDVDPVKAKDELRKVYASFVSERAPEKREELARQMKTLADVLVASEPDGLGGWLLMAEAAIVLKDGDAGFRAATELKRLKVEAAASAGNVLARTTLEHLAALGAWKNGAPVRPVAVATAGTCQKQPNGDEIIGPVPKVVEESPFGENDPYFLEWTRKYFGWDVPLIKLLLDEGFKPDSDESFDFYQFITGRFAKAAKARIKASTGFDANAVRREIRAGRPVLLWVNASDKRKEELVSFAATYRQDATKELPSAKDKEERARWPGSTDRRKPKTTEETEAYPDTWMVCGVNEARGEFIVNLGGFDEGYHALRIRAEELEFTTTDMFTFNP